MNADNVAHKGEKFGDEDDMIFIRVVKVSEIIVHGTAAARTVTQMT